MSDKPTRPGTVPVSLDKQGAAAGKAPASRPSFGLRGKGAGKGNLAADGSAMPPPPKQVRYTVLAMGVSALAALIASLSLFGLKSWLFRSAVKSNNKKKVADRQTVSELHHAVNSTATSSLFSTIILILALGIAARGVLRGRHWARWTVIVLWVLATFTGTFAGFTYLVGVASDEPIGFKVPSFVSALALIAAVVLVSLRPSAEYFALTRPPRPTAAAGGGPARRGGLFGPRPPRPSRQGSGAASAPTPRSARTGDAAAASAERSRAKQRATTESVAKGAELARSRAKASKSRRTDA